MAVLRALAFVAIVCLTTSGQALSHVAKECSTEPPGPQPGPITAEDFVSFDVTANCPNICSSFRITLFGDGRIHWEGRQWVQVDGVRDTRIAEKEAQRLVGALAGRDIWSLCAVYEHSSVHSAHLAWTAFELRVAGVTKKLRYEGAPEEYPLKRLEDIGQQIVDTAFVAMGSPMR